MIRPTHRQSGAALIVSLIMLLLISLIAVTSYRLSSGNLRIVGNAQQRNQALAAAQATVEAAVSSTQFTITPTSPLPAAGGGFTNTTQVDVNGDGVPEVTVVANASCVAIQPIPVQALDFSAPNDAGCLVGASQSFGIAGAATNNSLCSNSVWDINASATDVQTNANYVVDEGAAVRVTATTTC